CLTQGIALYDSRQHRALAFVDGDDPGVLCRGYAGYTLWTLGYADQALKKVPEALALARKLAHPYSLSGALLFAACLYQYLRDAQAAREQAEALISLSTEHGFPFFLTLATCVRGWALVEQGQEEEGLAQIRQGSAAWQAMGGGMSRTYHLAFMAEAYG